MSNTHTCARCEWTYWAESGTHARVTLEKTNEAGEVMAKADVLLCRTCRIEAEQRGLYELRSDVDPNGGDKIE